MGTTVDNPAYMPTTVEHMARKKLAQTEAEKEAAAAADPFQPAPIPASTSDSNQDQYARFATETDVWEARNSARMASLYQALENKDKRRKGSSKKQ